MLAATGDALAAAEAFLAAARAKLAERVAPAGRGEAEALNREQLAAHAFAWMASYVAALRQLRNWAVRLDDTGSFGRPRA